MIILDKRLVVMLHEQLMKETGGSQGIRDEGLLDSALSVPFQEFGGVSAYPTIEHAVELYREILAGEVIPRLFFHPCLDCSERRRFRNPFAFRKSLSSVIRSRSIFSFFSSLILAISGFR